MKNSTLSLLAGVLAAWSSSGPCQGPADLAVQARQAALGRASVASVRIVDAESFAGQDLGARLRAADEALGRSAGIVRVRSPGRLVTPLIVGAGHNLDLEAPVTWLATVTLSGSNDIRCIGQGTISAIGPAGSAIFAANGVNDLTIHDCSIHFATNSTVLGAEGVHELTMSHLSVTGGSIAQVNANHGADAGDAADHMTFLDNFVEDAPNTGGAAILLVNTTDATVIGNSFDGISTGTQWWGGDSARGNVDQVNRTGKITLSGNQCRNVTACLWGSMGYSIVVEKNKAYGCADVCFDTEGGLDTTFEGNIAEHCGNGCGAIFFFSRDIKFRANDFSGDPHGGGLIFIKNKSADPRSHSGFEVSGNKLSCLSVCNAFYQEAVSHAEFSKNTISNGVFASAGFGQNIVIRQNQFGFTRALAPNAAAISAPSITGGTTQRIEENTVTSSAPQGANAVCIAAIWNDYNNTDAYYISRNHCGGSSPFPIGILTNTAGANPGPHADWHVTDNVLGTGRIVHLKTTTNETYSATNNCRLPGCSDR